MLDMTSRHDQYPLTCSPAHLLDLGHFFRVYSVQHTQRRHRKLRDVNGDRSLSKAIRIMPKFSFNVDAALLVVALLDAAHWCQWISWPYPCRRCEPRYKSRLVPLRPHLYTQRPHSPLPLLDIRTTCARMFALPRTSSSIFDLLRCPYLLPDHQWRSLRWCAAHT